MNKVIFFLILTSITLTSCKSDNFYETKRYFKTDKNEYEVGDKIILTVMIRPIKEAKTIRLYDNYSNIGISFALMNSEMKMHNDRWTEWTGRNLPKNKIQEITITHEKPFLKQYEIIIREEMDSIFLTIPEFNYNVSFAKNDVLHPDTRVRIHGFCNPINPEFGASLEEYFEVKDIKIKYKNSP